MAKRVPLTVATILLLGMALPSLGQGASGPTLQVTRVQLSQWVSVQITVFSPEKDLFVPYCGESEGGTQRLCSLPTHLEIETKQGWLPAKLRTADAVLGGVPADSWKAQRIPAGRWHDFSFGFPQDEFAVERGQRLRVEVYAWPDEQSMKSGAPPIRLTSPTFECP